MEKGRGRETQKRLGRGKMKGGEEERKRKGERGERQREKVPRGGGDAPG